MHSTLGFELIRTTSRWLTPVLGCLFALLLPAVLAPEAQARNQRPPAPANVTVVRGDGTLSVTWDEVQWPGDNFGYFVFTSTNSGATWQLATTPDSTSATITGTNNQQAYHVGVVKPYRCYSDNSLICGGHMGVSALVPAAQAPGTVASIGLIRGEGYLDVTWFAPAHDGHIAMKGYDIVYSGNGGAGWHRAATEVLPNPNTDGKQKYRIESGIDDTLGYLVAVRAVNPVGAGPWRNGGPIPPLHTAPGAPTIPGAPAAVTVQRGIDYLDASWPAVAGATGYNVVYSSNNGRSWTRAATEIESTSYRIPNIPNTDSYIVAVQAVNEAGGGSWRNSASVGPI